MHDKNIVIWTVGLFRAAANKVKTDMMDANLRHSRHPQKTTVNIRFQTTSWPCRYGYSPILNEKLHSFTIFSSSNNIHIMVSIRNLVSLPVHNLVWWNPFLKLKIIWFRSSIISFSSLRTKQNRLKFCYNKFKNIFIRSRTEPLWYILACKSMLYLCEWALKEPIKNTIDGEKMLLHVT